jgi:EAL domain-containing protein (putative c-di-GMP-specific phosphodiesterase class I)
MDCDAAQGYYFNRPVSADKIAVLLEQQLASQAAPLLVA